eukprot:scaffold9348_cov162-Skeletonema_marinoi.AAC.1
MMSGVEESDDTMMCCAACGTAEGGDVKLKKCTACKSVRYCGVNCQKEHRPQHKRKCKKRAAELRDEILFKQPESSHLGDCPICCLPLPTDNDKFIMMSCCCKKICNGCYHSNMIHELKGSLERTNQMRELEMKLLPKCPFCRHSAPESEEEAVKNLQKRFEANDPVAILEMGLRRHKKETMIAAALGNIFAHHNLSSMYRTGLGVEKDKKKEVYHLEQAAIGGDILARYNLGCVEEEHGRMDRAVKHWIINAKLGDDNALEVLKNKYRAGCFQGGLSPEGGGRRIEHSHSPHQILEQHSSWQATKRNAQPQQSLSRVDDTRSNPPGNHTLCGTCPPYSHVAVYHQRDSSRFFHSTVSNTHLHHSHDVPAMRNQHEEILTESLSMVDRHLMNSPTIVVTFDVI